MFLDVLDPIISLFRKKEHPYKELTSLERSDYRRYIQIRDRIQERYEQSMDNPRHFEKVKWFARYWNQEVPANLFLRVRGAGLD